MTRSVLGLITTLVVSGLFSVAHADRYASTSYVIDASVTSNAGGLQASSSYRLSSSAGETVIGNGAGGSYRVGMGYIAQLEKSLQLTVQPGGIAGYFPFEEGSGTIVYDQSAGAQRATLATQTFGAGKVGGALQLDGTTNPATLADTSAYDFQSSDFTIEYWENPGSVSVTKDVMGKWQAGVGGFAIALANGQPLMFLNNTGVYRYCTGVGAGAWSHIAFVKAGTSLDCYVNGVLANGSLSGTPPANIGTTAQPFKFGFGRYGVSVQDGLDEVKLYSRALRSDEVQVEYSAMASGIPSGISLGTIIPGVSNTSLTDVITQTDAAGYTLAINQDHDLSDGASTIPAVSGSIASPGLWSEGTTKGLGFTLATTNATAIPGIWNAGNSYAALPGSATTFYTRAGSQSVTDVLTMRFRADVTLAQQAGVNPYTNQVTVTGTMVP